MILELIAGVILGYLLVFIFFNKFSMVPGSALFMNNSTRNLYYKYIDTVQSKKELE